MAVAVYKELAEREKESLQRSQAVIDWATTPACLSAKLASYFGDNGVEECGHCTFCLTGKAVDYTPAPKAPIDTARLKAVRKAIPDGEDVDALLLARLAWGISGPRLTSLKLGKHDVFGSMDDCDFEVSTTPFGLLTSLSTTPKC